MANANDPPSDERKRIDFWKLVRGVFRKLVTRETLMMAIRLIGLAVRIAQLLNKLFGDF